MASSLVGDKTNMIGFGGSPGIGWSYLDTVIGLKTNEEFVPVEHVLQSRQRKCKGFATASLSDSDDVAAAADDRPALGLDWGRLVKIFHHTHDFCVRAEVRKVLYRFVGLAQSACNWKVVKLLNVSL